MDWRVVGCLAVGCGGLLGVCGAPSERQAAPPKPWYTVGNLSVNLLANAWGSPLIEAKRKADRVQELIPRFVQGGGDPTELKRLGDRLEGLMKARKFDEAGRTLDRMLAIVGHQGALPRFDARVSLERERDAFLTRARAVGADGVEDYIGWAVVEPEPGKWDWSLYQENARRIKQLGLKYIPYVWIQNLPRRVRGNSDYRFATCLEHGRPNEFLSVFSRRTVTAYDRFFARLKEALGPQIDALRVGSPCDFGETHYPAAAASDFFPVQHTHIGWWVGEPEARQHFRDWAKRKYGTIQRLNRAWATRFASFDFDYPNDNAQPRRWLDFVAWYHEALTERLGILFDAARRHFPETPICVNLGWPFEKIALGQDLSGLVKMLASKKMTLRTPTGPMVSHLYTRRVATAARHYRPAGFSSEPVDGSAPLAEIAGALFKDLTTGVTWHFDYCENMQRARDLFSHARSLPRHTYVRTDAAIFFSTASHRLENWNNWREGFAGGYPEGMQAWLEELREILDYDVLDERLIEDGALKAYRMLVWPFGTRVEAGTLAKIRRWVQAGGTLLVRDLSAVRTIEGAEARIAAGKGLVLDGGGKLERLAEWIRTRGPRMTSLPPLDTRTDGVLLSLFEDGVMLFNRTEKSVRVALPTPPGEWRVKPPNLPRSIVLPPLAIRWVSAGMGESQSEKG